MHRTIVTCFLNGQKVCIKFTREIDALEFLHQAAINGTVGGRITTR